MNGLPKELKNSMKQWKIISKLKKKELGFSVDDLIDVLLANRDITTKKDREVFLNPKLADVTPQSVGINAVHLKKTLKRLQKAIENKEQMVVYGDYDVDGITGTAILWETLYAMGAKVAPYIPHRIEEGYGLSQIGIENLQKELGTIALIITVDNGIVANRAVRFANEQGIEIIITDHHAAGEKNPDALAIVHTTKLCGAGVAYLLAQELKTKNEKNETVILGTSKGEDSRIDSGRDFPRFNRSSLARMTENQDNHLELATLGTIADLVPLTGANRAIVAHGLSKLSQTKRPGLIALFQQAKIEKEEIATYHVGYMIAPRLNAAGRLQSGMDSLRLLCTKDKKRALELAAKIELINRERQTLMKDSTEHAVAIVREQGAEVKKLLIVSHDSYQEGVIGLIAGRLVEEFYRPAIVISKREKQSKASVRSVHGFNIIEFLRQYEQMFLTLGGHPMAAGFSVETEKLTLLQETLETSADGLLTEEILFRVLKIDCELPFFEITKGLYKKLQKLSPFGMGNPEPVFATRGVMIEEMRVLGKEGNHLKLVLSQEGQSFEAIAFKMGEMAGVLKIGDTIDVAYSLDENTWNGRTKIQLKVKDIKGPLAN